MLSLHTNAASLSTQNSLGSTNKALSSSMTKLGTGYRVNSAQDDAAGLQMATRLNAQSRGMAVAQKNTQNAISLLQTADGAMNEITSMAVRMKDLATERENGTNSDEDIAALKAEMTELGLQIKEVLDKTMFAGKEVFKKTDGFLGADIKFHVGAESDATFTIKQADSGHSDVIAASDTAMDGDTSIADLIDYVNAVGTFRSNIGAAANRLEHTYNNLGNMIQNTKAAEGRIMDVDYATETSNMTSKQMLMQASTSMLKQSNSMSQMVASLLQ